mmetsp:Transcript_23580/g.45351  ORF Transcript_23580/g.45351 Transcript_23580/m.45351 type:complete len:96 (-) Transcript_23580:1475-1762(-)
MLACNELTKICCKQTRSSKGKHTALLVLSCSDAGTATGAGGLPSDSPSPIEHETQYFMQLARLCLVPMKKQGGRTLQCGPSRSPLTSGSVQRTAC